MDKKISKLFFCHCAQLALSFHKIGGVSAMDKKISKLFFCHCAQLALSFNKIGRVSAMDKKSASCFFAIALNLHYLCAAQLKLYKSIKNRYGK